MYKANGIELDLDKTLLKKYCMLTGDELDTPNFDNLIECYIIALTEGDCKNIKEAVEKFGIAKTSKMLSNRFLEELNTIGNRYKNLGFTVS